MTQSVSIEISDVSQVGAARRLASTMAATLGFDAAGVGRVALIASEAGSNLAKFADRGRLILRSIPVGVVPGLEILSLDSGPGMADLSRCLADGHSTAGSPGIGLGAIRRLSDEFEIRSAPGSGTAMLSRAWADRAVDRPLRGGLDLGVVCVAKPGEVDCGDLWASADLGDRSLAFVVDGLGHGTPAADAARAATAAFCDLVEAPPIDILRGVHDRLRGTRGAVAAVVEVDRGAAVARFVGVGNISGSVTDGLRTHRFVSHNGTLGLEARKFQQFEAGWSPESSLELASDGVATHRGLETIPGMIAMHPALLAGLIYRDNARGRDDATVVVARDRGGEVAS